MSNTYIPDDRYAHTDECGNLIYHMTDKDYESWHSSTGFSCYHEDIDKNPNYKFAYSTDN